MRERQQGRHSGAQGCKPHCGPCTAARPTLDVGVQPLVPRSMLCGLVQPAGTQGIPVVKGAKLEVA